MVRGLVRCNSLRSLDECQLSVMGSSRAELKVSRVKLFFCVVFERGQFGIKRICGEILSKSW